MRTRFSVRCEHGLLQGILENTFPDGNEIDIDRWRRPGKETPKRLKIFSGEKTCRRDVRNHSADAREPYGQVRKYPIEVCVGHQGCFQEYLREPCCKWVDFKTR